VTLLSWWIQAQTFWNLCRNHPQAWGTQVRTFWSLCRSHWQASGCVYNWLTVAGKLYLGWISEMFCLGMQLTCDIIYVQILDDKLQQQCLSSKLAKTLKAYFHVRTDPSLVSILSQMNPIHILTLYIFKIHFNVMSVSQRVLSVQLLTDLLYVLLIIPMHKHAPPNLSSMISSSYI